ncbi:mitotic apparatus protein p62-like [Ananas comosus]|uniref:Mitotic apparatus protein p62-like n=1 Tax=Ananas comosus TaxID=4615 RepID=A0A6P5FHA7_ANACO|nr:mitotic apparatus protein p62-like [Ananas comosus]
MLRQSSSRNQRNKVLRVKHVLQMSLLVAVSFWLLYQLKHSYDKKKASVDENLATSSNLEEEQQRFVKLGRKDLPDNEEANLDEEREKEREAVKRVMEEEEEIGEGEQVRGNERDDEEREDEGEDADGRGRGEASRVAREDRDLEYEDDKSEENEEKMENGDENDEEKFVGDDDNNGDIGSTIDDDTNFGEGDGDGDGDGDSSLKKTVPDDNASTNGVGSNHNESIVGLDGKEGSLNDHHRHQIAASDGVTDNSVPLQNQTFNLESMEEEKHVSVKREIDEENKPTLNNPSFTLEQEDFGENSTVSVAANDVGDVDVNKLVADAHLDLSTLPVIQGEVVKDEEDTAE